MIEHPNRESWYAAAAELLRKQVFFDQDIPPFRVGCGWPTTHKDSALGVCFKDKCSSDKSFEIFISPRLDNPLEVLGTLVHELCHVVDRCENGHKKGFIDVAKAIGLEAPWKSALPGVDMARSFNVVLDALGPYPHAAMSLTKKEKKEKVGSRLLKVSCGGCELVFRMTQKWLDQVDSKTFTCWLCGGLLTYESNTPAVPPPPGGKK